MNKRISVDNTFNYSTSSLSSCLHEIINFIVSTFRIVMTWTCKLLWRVHWSSKYVNLYNVSWKQTTMTSTYMTWRARWKLRFKNEPCFIIILVQLCELMRQLHWCLWYLGLRCERAKNRPSHFLLKPISNRKIKSRP